MSPRFFLIAGMLAIIPLSQPSPGAAQEQVIAVEANGRSSLKDLFRIANGQNYQLMSQQRRIDAMKGRLRQARLYPNPVIGAQTDEVSSRSFDVGEGASSVSLGQPIVVGRRLRAAAAVEKAEIERAEAELEKVRRDVFREIHRSYVEILYNRDALALQFELIDEAQRLKEAMTQRKAGDFDRARIELELQEMKRAVLRYITERARAGTRLRALLGDSDIDPLHLQGRMERVLMGKQITRPEAELVDAHPEMAVARAAVMVAESKIALAKAERIPDVTIFGNVGYDGRTDSGMVGAGVSMPLPIFDRKQGAIAEADALMKAADRDRETTFNRLRGELMEAILLLNETDTLTADYQETYVPTASDAWKLAAAGYRDGNLGVTESIDALRTYSRVRQTELEYVRDYNDALNGIRYFEGYE
ncbi:TolC family protein [Candidatus Sumerlaeota bacterium]|nr:TolC family protein [Candidatus Sumerlaeota bacterium]